MTKKSYEMSAANISGQPKCGIINKGYQADNSSGVPESKAAIPSSEKSPDGVDVKNDQKRNDSVDDIYCGVGSCRPSVMQGCKNMACFSVMYSINGLITSALISYINSQITTLEKHFNLSSSMSGFLMSCNDIGYLVTTLSMSYYTRRVHIPRALAACSILYGVSGLLCTVAFFATKDQLPSLPNYNLEGRNLSAQTAHSTRFTQGCQTLPTSADAGCQSASQGSNADLDISEKWRTISIVIIATGMILQGIAKSPRQAFLGTYVDDNVPRTKTTLYLGIMTGVSLFGPSIAFGLGGVFSSIYITLEDTSISQRDPRWLGAWWLGFLVFGISGILVALPLIFFPKRMLVQKSLDVIKEKNKVDKTGVAKFWHDVKGLLRSVLRMMINPVFVCLTLAAGLEMMAIAGAVAFLPKYLETQFTLTAGKANIFLGAMQIAATPLGTIAGGALTSKLKLSPTACLKLIIGLKTLATAVFCLGFVIGCDQPVVLKGVGTNSNGTLRVSQCVHDCHCDARSYFPVCGQDSNSYFSPCHAGCTYMDSKIFTNCSCLATQEAHTATGGLCEQNCAYFYPYIAVFFVTAFSSTMSIMPGFISLVRCVKEEDKPLAIGLNAFVGTLIGWLPGPVVFGALIDSTCMTWKTTCSTTGACTLYNIELFRFRFHLLFSGLRCGTVILCILALVFAVCLKRAMFQPHRDEVFTVLPEQKINEAAENDAESVSKEKKAEIK